MEMIEVRLSSQRSTPVHKFLATRIEETALENLCSNMPFLEVDSCLLLFYLICLFLVFLVKCCSRSSLKPARPMCHGRPFAWRVEAPFSAVSRFDGFYTLRYLLTRSITVLVATPYSKKDPLNECSRPCDNLSCLLFTALWLQQSQSILVQEIQLAKDIDLTCYRRCRSSPFTCLQVGPMFLEWPVDPIARFDQSSPSSSPEDPNDEHQEGALPASTRSRWKQNALQPPQVQHGTAGRDTRGHFPDGGLRCIKWNTRGLVGSVFSSQKNRELKLKYFRKLLDNNNITCLQEGHGKDVFLQAIQVLAPRFRFFGTFIHENENVCIHRDLLPDEALVTHLVTCHGRDHLVNIRSEQHNLVIVNVHFEIVLILRQLRDTLRLSHRHWLAYPNGVGIILGDFNICDPEEGRFNVRNQTFTDGDPRKTAVHVLNEIAQPDYTRRDSTALGIIGTLSRIDRIFL